MAGSLIYMYAMCFIFRLAPPHGSPLHQAATDANLENLSYQNENRQTADDNNVRLSSSGTKAQREIPYTGDMPRISEEFTGHSSQVKDLKHLKATENILQKQRLDQGLLKPAHGVEDQADASVPQEVNSNEPAEHKLQDTPVPMSVDHEEEAESRNVDKALSQGGGTGEEAAANVDPHLQLLDSQLRNILKSPREEGAAVVSGSSDWPVSKPKAGEQEEQEKDSGGGVPAQAQPAKTSQSTATPGQGRQLPKIPTGVLPVSAKKPPRPEAKDGFPKTLDLVATESVEPGRHEQVGADVLYNGCVDRAGHAMTHSGEADDLELKAEGMMGSDLADGGLPQAGGYEAEDEAQDEDYDDGRDKRKRSVGISDYISQPHSIAFGGVEEKSYTNVYMEDPPTTNMYYDDHATRAAPFTIASQFQASMASSEEDTDGEEEQSPHYESLTKPSILGGGTAGSNPGAITTAVTPSPFQERRRSSHILKQLQDTSEKLNEKIGSRSFGRRRDLSFEFQKDTGILDNGASRSTQDEKADESLVKESLQKPSSEYRPVRSILEEIPKPKFSTKSPSSPAKLSTLPKNPSPVKPYSPIEPPAPVNTTCEPDIRLPRQNGHHDGEEGDDNNLDAKTPIASPTKTLGVDLSSRTSVNGGVTTPTAVRGPEQAVEIVLVSGETSLKAVSVTDPVVSLPEVQASMVPDNVSSGSSGSDTEAQPNQAVNGDLVQQKLLALGLEEERGVADGESPRRPTGEESVSPRKFLTHIDASTELPDAGTPVNCPPLIYLPYTTEDIGMTLTGPSASRLRDSLDMYKRTRIASEREKDNEGKVLKEERAARLSNGAVSGLFGKPEAGSSSVGTGPYNHSSELGSRAPKVPDNEHGESLHNHVDSRPECSTTEVSTARQVNQEKEENLGTFHVGGARPKTITLLSNVDAPMSRIPRPCVAGPAGAIPNSGKTHGPDSASDGLPSQDDISQSGRLPGHPRPPPGMAPKTAMMASAARWVQEDEGDCCRVGQVGQCWCKQENQAE